MFCTHSHFHAVYVHFEQTEWIKIELKKKEKKNCVLAF